MKNCDNITKAKKLARCLAKQERQLARAVKRELRKTNYKKEGLDNGVIKNQGSCGSCWAFTATANMEVIYKYETGNDIWLSEQQLLDCSSGYGNNGCGGGIMRYAFQYVMEKGITTNAKYPYQGVQQSCSFSPSGGDYRIGGYLTGRDCSTLADYLVTYGPVSVAMDADNLQNYVSGRVDGTTQNINHALLLVGVKKVKGQTGKHWYLRNSWGVNWGMGGYVIINRLEETKNCGVCKQFEVPLPFLP